MRSSTNTRNTYGSGLQGHRHREGETSHGRCPAYGIVWSLRSMEKISIRFYYDHEVRAVWSEENNKWFFSVLDVLAAINNQDDYQKTRNYQKFLKNKLKAEESEVVSATNQLKLLASDGKRRLTDVLDADAIHSRELFMKGIDYSYYYEQED